MDRLKFLFLLLLFLFPADGKAMQGSASDAKAHSYCFSGAAQHAYSDERMSIGIQERHEDGLSYYICDVKLHSADAFHVGFAFDTPNGGKERASDIAMRAEAVLAINGDCYTFHGDGVIIRNGEIIRTQKSKRHLLTMLPDGTLTITTNRDANQKPQDFAKALLAAGVLHTWEFGPELIRDGQIVPFDPEFGLISVKDSTLEPRTAIGQIAPLHYVLIVADGRQEDSEGASLQKLQELFIETGVQLAFNLDGGGSTTLYFNGQVLNEPSGSRERRVSDIIFFK